MRQDTGRPGTVGEELAAVFLGRDAEADGVFLQRDGTVADTAVEAQTGDVQDVLRLDHHGLAVAGGIGVRQVALAVPIHIHVIREQRIQADHRVLSAADDLAVAVSVEKKVCQHDSPA